jgi:hypothetical protein
MNPPSISNSSGGVLQVMMSKIKEILNFLPRLQVEGDGKTTYVEHTPTKTIIHVKSNPVQEVNEIEDVEERYTPWSVGVYVNNETVSIYLRNANSNYDDNVGIPMYLVNGSLHQMFTYRREE